jgi:hypothetical protein
VNVLWPEEEQVYFVTLGYAAEEVVRSFSHFDSCPGALYSPRFFEAQLDFSGRIALDEPGHSVLHSYAASLCIHIPKSRVDRSGVEVITQFPPARALIGVNGNPPIVISMLRNVNSDDSNAIR